MPEGGAVRVELRDTQVPERWRARADRIDVLPAEPALTVLSNPTSRTLLQATATPKTAAELSTECEIPPSTVYRHLHRLTDLGLLEESIRLQEDGRHPRQYQRCVNHVAVAFSDE